MRLFYAPEITNQMTLDENESGHAIRTLRMKSGDELYLINGQGEKYSAVIKEAHPKACELSNVKLIESIPKPQRQVHLAFSPPKSSDRLEWLIEKSVEIGVSELTPLLCQRSERKKINEPRLQKVMVSALKQSGNYWMPILHPMQAMNNLHKTEATNKFIAHCQSEDKESLSDKSISNDVIFLVGPEGDFSKDEIEMAANMGFESVSLGQNTLRTETACIVGTTLLLFA